MLFYHRPTRTKAGQKLISHRAHRDTKTNLFIAVERTAMKNKLGAEAHTGRRPEGYEKSASHRFFIKSGRLTLRTLRAPVTGGNGREEKVVPEGPDVRRKTSRLPLVLPLSVAKKIALLFLKGGYQHV
jgi:hypothetical protein